ncbi:MAG: hypothetical protein K0M50_02730 [Prolixibacteraceae bacterium]|jgi:hypothetical protein|nr:hypothetical protein [Prolixibacteraceae bacterium]
MKTPIKPNFSIPGHDQLTNKLRQLACEFPLSYIFYHPTIAKEAAHIVIIAKDSRDVEPIELRKWIRNNRDENPIWFHISCQSKIKAELRAGNPFFGWYCQKSAIIYQNPSAKSRSDTDWPSFKKRFKRYALAYHHDRDNLLAAVNRFQELDSLTGLFVSYLSVFEYTIQYLEMLYAGRCFEPENLHQRIKKLIFYIPEIESLFVQKNGNEYYLIFELEKANDFAEDGDEIRLNDKLMDSFSQAEEKLHKMVLSRLSELKASIKSGLLKQPFFDHVEKTTEEDDKLKEIAAQIVKIHPVEEIYLFHQVQTSQQTTYFLLLIGESVGTETLNRIQQSVNSRFEGKYSVVLIGHSRSWIQTNLFYQQSFFRKIMKPENLRFQSHPNHPSIHWEDNNAPDYPDLEYLNRSAIKLSAQYFVLRNHSEKDNTEGIFDLFGKCVMRIFRTLVYSKLSYLPHYLSAYNLWKLCVYAEPKLEKLEYLFEKLNGVNFFKDVDHHTRFHHDVSRLTEKKLMIADEILNTLLKELNIAFNRIKEANDEEE